MRKYDMSTFTTIIEQEVLHEYHAPTGHCGPDDILATPALAEREQTIYLNPFAGFQLFDDKRDLSETGTLGIGAEFRFHPNWAVEGVYSRRMPIGSTSMAVATLKNIDWTASITLPARMKPGIRMSRPVPATRTSATMC